jgi:hypothetical protein
MKTETLEQIRDKLYEAQSVLRHLYVVQAMADNGETIADYDHLCSANRAGAIKVAHDLISVVHNMLDQPAH